MLSGVLWEAVPVLIAVVSFAAFALTGNTLTAEIAFTALSLFDIMVEPCTSFGWVMADTIMAHTGFKRVGRYLDSPDLQGDAVTRLPAAGPGQTGPAVRIVSGNFSWGGGAASGGAVQLDGGKAVALAKDWDALTRKEKASAESLSLDGKSWQALRVEHGHSAPAGTKPFELSGINFEVPAGGTWAVVGPVGSGKSSLLHALLGEMDREIKPGSCVELRGTTAFAAQSAFVVNATIRENICFGKVPPRSRFAHLACAVSISSSSDRSSSHHSILHCDYSEQLHINLNLTRVGQPFDKLRYGRVIDACCLRPDLSLMKAGDATEVGEQG